MTPRQQFKRDFDTLAKSIDRTIREAEQGLITKQQAAGAKAYLINDLARSLKERAKKIEWQPKAKTTAKAKTR